MRGDWPRRHGHLDHCGGTAELARRRKVSVEGPHQEDRFWIDQLPQAGMRYGFPPLEVFTPEERRSNPYVSDRVLQRK